MHTAYGSYKPKKPPRLTREAAAELKGKEIIYCPEDGWYTDGGAGRCPECNGRLRFWFVEGNEAD